MNERRLKPEIILAKIKEEERLKEQGKLKIFFGAAPGVGKTHTMLEEAIEKMAEGIDIVAGIVESHGRTEIDAMLTKLEQIPRRSSSYHGRVLQEFDLDAVLTRRPMVVLVDELAHTNLPNSRFVKRWQDVKEILDHGIDVYTTLNVQHIESINDIVTQITGITVRETVPDSILESANSVELIDLPPDDLLRRLHEGKVYAHDQAELASKNFFNKGNLIALRELALRITAERVNAQVLSYREAQSIQKTWPTTERVLVCISPDMSSTKLVRVARRMASRLQAKWMAVYVSTPKQPKLSEVEQHNLNTNIRLVERLGGEAFTLQSNDVVEEVINFARDHNVTKIIVGKDKTRSRLKTFLFGSMVDELIRNSGDVDVYIVQGGYEKTPRLLPILEFRPQGRKQSYLIGLAMVVSCSILGAILFRFIDLASLSVIYVLGVLLIALRGEYLPAIAASVISVLVLDYFFVQPYLSFRIHDTKSIVSFLVMFLSSLVLIHVAVTNKRKIGLARLRERRTSAIYALTRKLVVARGEDKILEVSVRHIGEVFESHVAALIPDEDGKLIKKAVHGLQFTLDEKEQSVAQWVYDLGQIAGLGTQTLPFARAIYVPLLGAKLIYGVLRILPVNPTLFGDPGEIHLLETFAHQIALSIEADR